jgi:ubiquinone/menaquinone biosynthesis C-methylase UbiE
MAKHHPHDYLPAAGHDALLPGYDLLTRLMGFASVYRTLIAQAELEDGHRVLEIGCGTGNLTTRVKRAHPAVEAIGSDPDPRALDRAQRKAARLTGIRFERGYAQRLPYADGEFDRVLSSMMLHHLDDGAKTAAAAEVYRVLRPGGRLHLVDMGGDMTAHDGLAARLVLRSHHAAGNLGDAIPGLLRAAGFDCAEVATQRHRVVGRLTYYRATRPA